MKVPTYRSALAEVAVNQLTVWRHLPWYLGRIRRSLPELVEVVLNLVFAIVGLLLAIVAPLLVVLSPIGAWFSYRREMRRYEEIYSRESKEWI